MLLTNNRLIPQSRGRHNSCSVESPDLRRPGQRIWAEVILNVLYKYFYVLTCPVLWTQYSSSATPSCRWGGPGTCWSTGTCPGGWRRARSGSLCTQTVGVNIIMMGQILLHFVYRSLGYCSVIPGDEVVVAVVVAWLPRWPVSSVRIVSPMLQQSQCPILASSLLITNLGRDMHIMYYLMTSDAGTCIFVCLYVGCMFKVTRWLLIQFAKCSNFLETPRQGLWLSVSDGYWPASISCWLLLVGLIKCWLVMCWI